MIWRLEYHNKDGDVARLDIQKGDATPVEIIEGTENPFLLSYELEGKNKKGFIMSSFADISIYETPTFNIDDLKTSNETELSVKWYINSVLEWTGFVVPDFFSREIGEPAIVNLAASDRLSALQDATLDGLVGYINMKDLLEACLAKTGLALPLSYTVDFKTKINGSTIDFMYIVASAERLQDDKGKRISCYDILRSILVLSNSTIRQRNGSWTLINKIQHEAVSPQLTFNEVYAGAKRTIQPVFSSVGAFQEFGGGDRYPKNYDFKVAAGWTPKNGFSYVRENREILGYTIEQDDAIPIYGAVTNNYQLFNKNNLEFHPSLNLDTSPYLESSKDLIPYDSTSIGIECILTATGVVSYEVSGSFVRFTVIAESDTKKLILNQDGVFVPFSNERDNVLRMLFYRNEGDASQMATKSATFKGKLTVNTNVSDYKISIRIYGYSEKHPTFIDSIFYKFKSDEDIGKGMLYRTEQMGVFSKKNDPETTIFGDYISNGLNGYFYPFSIEDTSILRSPVDTELLSRRWTTATDPAAGELPILQHVARQNSRMFGVAHNVLSAVIDAKTFDPLAIVTNCAGEKYVIVYSVFDFLRSTVEAELQQIVYGTLERRDFIYNYFGGEDDGIRSIGAASSGGTSIGGGGSFLDKYFTFDDENDALIANVSLVSEKELAAYFGSGSGLPSIWDDLPVASAVTLGGIKVDGFGLKMVGEFLRIDGDTFNFDNYYTKANLYTSGESSVHWGNLKSKPTSFPPSAHTHDYAPNTGSVHSSIALGTSDLDSIKTPGFYYQSSNANSTSDRNYPTTYAGTLIVATAAGVTQTYIPYGNYSTTIYTRGWYNNAWSPWSSTHSNRNLPNPIQGTGSAGKVAWWKSATELDWTSKLTYDFTNSLLQHQGHTTLMGSYSLPVTGGTDINGSLRVGGVGTSVSMDIGVSANPGAYGPWFQGRNAGDQSYYYPIFLNPNGGGVAIGKTSVTSGYTLDVNGNTRVGGNILATGEVTAYTASDKRLKTNINKFGNALSIIDKLTPVTYNWNAKAVELNGNKDMTGVNYGLIAQEVEKIAPHLIRKVYGDFKTYDDRGLMTIMLQALKELASEVKKLKNK